MPRSLATLTIAFGLVAIPVRLYSCARREAVLRFRYMTAAGEPVRQRLEAQGPPSSPGDDATGLADDPAVQTPRATSGSTPVLAWRAEAVPPVGRDDDVSQPPVAARPAAAAEPPGPGAAVQVGRSSLMRGLEIEPGRFVLFTPQELEALATPARDSIDLVAFVPPDAVDPVYVQKSYYLAPAQRGERAFALLVQALQRTRLCALARWAWKGREHPALLRAGGGALVLHQLHAGDAVRPVSELGVEPVDVSAAELALAERLVRQSAVDAFDPMQFIDPARQRVLDAARRKLAGGEAIERRRAAQPVPDGTEVVDLLAALRASLAAPASKPRRPPRRAGAAVNPAAGGETGAPKQRRRG